MLLAPQPHPRRFFPSTSPVLDFPYGNLGAVSELLEDHELLFVMYYAPWCAKSLRSRHEFERAATYMQDQVSVGSLHLSCTEVLRPPLNKKLFPVNRPSGLKRVDWILSPPPPLFGFFFFFPYIFCIFQSIEKRKAAFWGSTRRTGNDFSLKGGLRSGVGCEYVQKCV